MLGTAVKLGVEFSVTARQDKKIRAAIEARLVVRRVRPTPGSQLALFTTWDYHAFVTNRPGDALVR